MNYAIPAQFHSTELEIKKSRFITWVKHVENREQAMAFLAKARKEYPDARHHCWAYQIGSPQQPTSAAMSDDGEPSGTAGKPIFNVIRHKDIGDVMIIVIRYFGGIRLGAGGLVRAYSNAAEQIISELPRRQQVEMSSHTLTVDFAKEQLVRHWLNQHNGQVAAVDYQSKVKMTVVLPSDLIPQFSEFSAAI